jgi:hypothetical protein
MTEARLIEFFKQKDWPDAELHVRLAADSAACDATTSSSGSGSSTLLKLPVHRVLLSGSEMFRAQVRTSPSAAA